MSDTKDYLVIAHLPEGIEPLDRGEWYEDPLQEALTARNLGEVTGGGTEMGKGLKPNLSAVAVDLDILLTDLEEGVAEVIRVLEERGAPRGSELKFEESLNRPAVPFGKTEGVGLLLDGTSLSPEAYTEESIQSCFAQIQDALAAAHAGALHGTVNTGTHTCLNIYGPSRGKIRESLKAVLTSHPLCEKHSMIDL